MASFWFSILLGLVLLINSECSLTDQLEIFVNKTGHVTISGERVRRFPFNREIRNKNFGMSEERNYDCVKKHLQSKCEIYDKLFFTDEDIRGFESLFEGVKASTLLINLTSTKTVTSYEKFGEETHVDCKNNKDYANKCTATMSLAVADSVQATSSHGFEFGAEARWSIGFHFIGSSELEVKLAGKYNYGSAHQVSNSRITTISNNVEVLVPPHHTSTVIYKPKYHHAVVDIFFKYIFSGSVIASYKKPCNGIYYHAYTLSEFMKMCYPDLNDTLTDTYKTSSQEGITSSIF